MRLSASQAIFLFRWTLFAAASAPLLWMFWAWHADALGVFPEERLLHQLGRLGLLLLLLTLTARPAFRITGWPGFMAVRRQVGLWSFAYLMLHAVVWLWLHQMWEWDFIRAELVDLRYLQVGAVSLLLLIPLAVTDRKSTRLNSSHVAISYAVFCLKKKTIHKWIDSMLDH